MENNNTQRLWKALDKPVLLIYLFLVIAGWFNIYSVVYDPETTEGFQLASRYGKQLLFIGFTFLLALFSRPSRATDDSVKATAIDDMRLKRVLKLQQKISKLTEQLTELTADRTENK